MNATPDSIPQRVARGVAVLDHFLPDWEFRVDLETLDIGSCASCALGQLCRSFREGRIDLFGPAPAMDKPIHNYWEWSRQAGECGFDNAPFGKWEDLTAEWKRVILARRATALAAHLSIQEALK